MINQSSSYEYGNFKSHTYHCIYCNERIRRLISFSLSNIKIRTQARINQIHLRLPINPRQASTASDSTHPYHPFLFLLASNNVVSLNSESATKNIIQAHSTRLEGNVGKRKEIGAEREDGRMFHVQRQRKSDRNRGELTAVAFSARARARAAAATGASGICETCLVDILQRRYMKNKWSKVWLCK